MRGGGGLSSGRLTVADVCGMCLCACVHVPTSVVMRLVSENNVGLHVSVIVVKLRIGGKELRMTPRPKESKHTQRSKSDQLVAETVTVPPRDLVHKGKFTVVR